MNKILKSLGMSIISVFMFVAFLVPINADSTPENVKTYIEEGFSKIVTYKVGEKEMAEIYGIDGTYVKLESSLTGKLELIDQKNIPEKELAALNYELNKKNIGNSVEKSMRVSTFAAPSSWEYKGITYGNTVFREFTITAMVSVLLAAMGGGWGLTMVGLINTIAKDAYNKGVGTLYWAQKRWVKWSPCFTRKTETTYYRNSNYTNKFSGPWYGEKEFCND